MNIIIVINSRYSQNTASNNNTSSLMPQYTTMTICNSDLNETQLIREAEEMENLLIPPSNSSSTSQKESDCIICNTSALVDTFIICSLCSI